MRFNASLLRCTLLLLALVCLASGLRAQAPPPRERPVEVAQSSDLSLEEALLGIIAYSRWPVPPDPLRLCVLGNSPAASRLLQNGLARQPDRAPVQVRSVTPDTNMADACDAVYVGQLEEGAWRQVLPRLLAQPLLTICERSPVCASGGMFCLDIDAAGHVQFEVNIDSVARSKVRVHPQVLRLGRRHNGVVQ